MAHRGCVSALQAEGCVIEVLSKERLCGRSQCVTHRWTGTVSEVQPREAKKPFSVFLMFRGITCEACGLNVGGKTQFRRLYLPTQLRFYCSLKLNMKRHIAGIQFSAFRDWKYYIPQFTVCSFSSVCRVISEELKLKLKDNPSNKTEEETYVWNLKYSLSPARLPTIFFGQILYFQSHFKGMDNKVRRGTWLLISKKVLRFLCNHKLQIVSTGGIMFDLLILIQMNPTLLLWLTGNASWHCPYTCLLQRVENARRPPHVISQC